MNTSMIISALSCAGLISEWSSVHLHGDPTRFTPKSSECYRNIVNHKELLDLSTVYY